ncbi:MAG TPA: ABC transporter permease [Candidatus Angelobacter sp.]|nr:ABC transporter permease [Candidatus Angelobacter sp.]
MRNLWIIARREYLERIRTKAFIITTILIPALMGGSLFVPMLLLSGGGSSKHLVLVASDRHMAEVISQQLNRLKEEENEQNAALLSQREVPKREMPRAARFQIDIDTDTSAEQRQALAEKVKNKKIDGAIWATADALTARKVAYITRDTSSLSDQMEVASAVSHAVQLELLRSKGLSEADIQASQKRVEVTAENPTGAKNGNPVLNLLAMIFLVIVLFMSVLLYGVQVMQAVLEEKSSRVMEVMLSTAQPKELMAGKIVGVGAVGLTQVAIWIAAGAAFSFSSLAANSAQLKDLISWKVVLGFPLFYLLGYVFYSALYAAIGAMCNSQQEAQQVQQLVTIPLMIPAFLISYVAQNPGAPLSVAASMIPLTSPLIMYARIALNSAAPWEIAISLVLQLVAIYVVILLSAKIYRVGILMYGKKPTLPEIMKWIKYA